MALVDTRFVFWAVLIAVLALALYYSPKEEPHRNSYYQDDLGNTVACAGSGCYTEITCYFPNGKFEKCVEGSPVWGCFTLRQGEIPCKDTRELLNYTPSRLDVPENFRGWVSWFEPKI